MPTIGFADFLRFVRRRNVFAYNLRLVALAVDELEDVCADATVLDVGAGARLKHFRQEVARARRVVGVDLSHADLRANADIHDAALGDGERLPFADQSFECILSVDAVEHMQQPTAFFGEVARCLKPGGVAIICTPNLLGYKNIITYLMPRALLDLAWRVLRGRPGQPHRTYYRANTPRRLRQVSASVGLTVDHLSYLNEVSHFFYPHPALAVIAYLYGHSLEALHLERLLNYMVCVLHKPVPEQAAPPDHRVALTHLYGRERQRLALDEALRS